MPENIFPIFYLVGLIVGGAIRGYYVRKYRSKSDRLPAIYRQEGLIVAILVSLWGIAILIPLPYMFTGWLDFANYNLPTLVGWIGVGTFAASIWLLQRSHTDLGRHWSVTTELKEGHKLITDGVFRYIRHPMYAAHGLWGIAQALLIQNWIAGLCSLVIIAPVYFLRVPREEKMMLEQFGSEYRQYMNKTGGIIPRLFKPTKSI